MLRIAYTLGTLILASAAGIFAFSFLCWSRPDLRMRDIQDRPGAAWGFREAAARSEVHAGETKASPLVVQAEILAQYLNPPKDTELGSVAVPTPAVGSSPVATVRPAAPSARFRLHGTSYYANEPGRSMALVSEVGAAEDDGRWVKEGTRLGHFVIHEIRGSGIVYRDGEQLREMFVESASGPSSLVREIRPGSRSASAAVGDVGATLPIPAGPNGVGITGN
jgi:hypothetical protein